MKAVVVLSGGQDSATALAMAVKKHGAENVAAITYAYGQRHALETKFARRLAKGIFKIALWKRVPLSFYSSITDNALLSKDVAIAKKKGAKCPNTVVEGRRLPCGVHSRTRKGDAPCARLAGQVRDAVHPHDQGGGVGPCGEARDIRRY